MPAGHRVTSGTAKKDIITSTFRLLHFHAGGKGIGIGGAAPQRGLKVYDNIEAESFNGQQLQWRMSHWKKKVWRSESIGKTTKSKAINIDIDSLYPERDDDCEAERKGRRYR